MGLLRVTYLAGLEPTRGKTTKSPRGLIALGILGQDALAGGDARGAKEDGDEGEKEGDGDETVHGSVIVLLSNGLLCAVGKPNFGFKQGAPGRPRFFSMNDPPFLFLFPPFPLCTFCCLKKQPTRKSAQKLESAGATLLVHVFARSATITPHTSGTAVVVQNKSRSIICLLSRTRIWHHVKVVRGLVCPHTCASSRVLFCQR